jgi:hypothetical protein
MMYNLLDAVKDDLGLKTPDVFSILCGECGQVCVGQAGRPLRPWRDNPSHMAHAIRLVSRSLRKHRPSHPNPGPQNPFQQSPVRGPPYLFKTAKSFFLDCWTLKIKLSSSETSRAFCPTIQHHTPQDTSFRKTSQTPTFLNLVCYGKMLLYSWVTDHS